jgi:serine/threonine-protein kinase RsbW
MRKNLNIPSEIANLRLVEKAIDELSLELDLSDEIYGNVLVATMEATNNAIVHGNKTDPQKKVRIDIETGEREVRVLLLPLAPLRQLGLFGRIGHRHLRVR